MSGVKVQKPHSITPDFPRVALIEAAAGTGKTWLIERLVVELLLTQRLEIEQILVVTFTRAAAAEMAGRIHETLVKLRDAPEPASAPGPTWTIGAEERARLARAVANFDQAPISTIHSFCQAVLEEQVVLSGLLRDPTSPEPGALLHDCTAAHLRAVAAAPSPAREVLEGWVLTGQTLGALEGLLADANAEVLDPGDVLARFRPRVDDAVLELRRKGLLAAFAGPLPEDVEADHATQRKEELASVLAAVKALAESEEAGQLGPRAFQLRFLERVAPLVKSKPDYFPTPTEKLAGRTRELVTAMGALFLAAPTPQAIALATFLSPVHQAWEAACRRRGASDFDRLLKDTRRALAEDTTGALRARLRERYRGVLVDEFQDTDEVQWEILRGVFVAPGAQTHFVAVGDPKQAIYGFRGGDLQTYVTAKQALTQGRGLPPLRDNHRSTPALVAAYNQLLLSPGDDADPGPFFGPPAEGVTYTEQTRVRAAGSVGRLLDGKGGAPLKPFGLLHLHDVGVAAARSRILEHFVREAGRLVSGGGFLDGLAKPRFVEPRDLMVLVNTNREARQYVEALTRAGVRAEQYRAEGLMTSPEAEELCEVFEALCEPEAPVSIVKAMRALLFEMPLDELEQVRALPPTDARVLAWRRWARAAEERRWVELFSELLHGPHLARRLSLTAADERRLLTVRAILDRVHALARDRCPDVRALARRLRAIVDGEEETGEDTDDNVYPASEEANAVRVLTAFKAKGLKAPVVFLALGPRVDREQGDLHVFHAGTPARRLLYAGASSLAPEGERIRLERTLEGRRLQYVALTRAQHRVLMPWLTAPPSKDDRKKSPGLVMKPAGAGSRYAALNERLHRLRGDPAFGVHADVTESAPLPPLALPLADVGALGAAPRAPVPVVGPVLALARGLARGSFSSLHLSFPSDQPAPGRAGDELRAVEIPRGVAAGRVVHKLLELAPLGATVAGQAFEAWRQRPEIEALFSEHRAPSTWTAPQAEHLERLVHRALHVPVHQGDLSLGGLGLLGGGLHREVGFNLPWPTAAHPWGTTPAGRWRLDHGVLTGSMDFAFEHGGRVYFGDWKSNALEGYTPALVTRSVRADYEGQVRIYTLALCRLYGLLTKPDYERFGGALYVFLRGFEPGGAGVALLRPSWEEIASLDARLRAMGERPTPPELEPALEVEDAGGLDEPDEDPEGEGVAA